MGRTGKQLQTAGGGNSETGDYIQLSLFPQNEQEQADYGTAAGDKPAAVFAFPETYIDEALRTGGNDDHSLEYVLLDLMQKKPGELLRKDLKEAWKGGKGLFMPDGGSKVFIKMDNLLQKNCRKKNLIRYGRE